MESYNVMKEERVMESKDGYFFATQTVVERYDAEELLNILMQLRTRYEANLKNMEGLKEAIKFYEQYEQEATEKRKKELELAKKQREEALSKLKH